MNIVLGFVDGVTTMLRYQREMFFFTKFSFLPSEMSRDQPRLLAALELASTAIAKV